MSELLYEGHGSFRLTSASGAVFYIDPYAGDDYEMPADIILITHEHGDHNRVEIVAKKETTEIYRETDFLKDGVYGEKTLCGARVYAVEAYNKNHPIDKCVGYVIEIDGKKLYFAGDTSTTKDMKTKLKDTKLDYAFLPTDGIYNMDVKEASKCAKLIDAAHSVPVHMAPGKLFSEEVAERFDGPGKLIIRPGEKICL